MKTLLEEYGRIILGASIGMVVLGILMWGITEWYSASYPSMEGGYIVSVESGITTEPVLLVEPIEIPVMETSEIIDYASYATAYCDNDLSTIMEVEVIGAEQVDVTTKGLYEIQFCVSTSQGIDFWKNVPVIIY